MDRSQVEIGVIFARNGISGKKTDALRWIHDYFQREGKFILVTGDDVIQRLREGESFYQLLDQSMYRRRFDFD